MSVLQEYYTEWSLLNEAVHTHAKRIRMHGLEEASHMPLNEQQTLADVYARRAQQFIDALNTIEEAIDLVENNYYQVDGPFNRQADYPIHPDILKANDD